MKKKSKKPLLLLLFIPAIAAAVILWSFAKNTTSVTEVTLSAQKFGEKSVTEDEELKFYSALIRNADQIESAIRPMEEYEKFTLIVKYFTGEDRYTLLLSGSPADCLFTDAEGKLYRIDTESAQKLLMSEGMDYVNPNYAFPEMVLGDGESYFSLLDCQTADWTYKKPDESYGSRVLEFNRELEFVLPTGITPVLNFSVQPDWNRVTVKNGDQVIFDDSADQLSAFAYTGDARLKVSVSAHWNQRDNADFYGEASADFTLVCDAPAQFDISAKSVSPGGLIAILAKDCLADEVKLSTEIIGSEKASVVDYAGQRIILLPVSLENKTGKYSVTVEGEGQKESFELEIENREFGNSVLQDLTTAQLNAAYNKEEKLFHSLMSVPSPDPLWSEAFSEPVGGEDTWISSRFGAYVKIGPVDTGLRNGGLDYVQRAQTFISAVNDGTVIFAQRSDYSGNTVIIDHGLGIYSVYGCLESINVSEGMKVYKSQTVGTLGNSGITGGTYLHFEMRVGGECVDPYTFLGKDPDFFDLKLAGN